LGQPEREKACAIVAASSGIGVAVNEARTYVERARDATSGVSNHALQEGLTQLATELLSDLPG
jgi:hypothetical protein